SSASRPLGRPPPTTPFPYTTLFRSERRPVVSDREVRRQSLRLDDREPGNHADLGPTQSSISAGLVNPTQLRRLEDRSSHRRTHSQEPFRGGHLMVAQRLTGRHEDRKSTRLNSSHVKISYAVFCLKKKKTKK